MSSFSPPAPSVWREAKAPDGRTYYYNDQTKATQWTKPAELMSAAEKALTGSPWKEYSALNGRKYWHNTETNVTTWEMPEALKSAQPQQPASLPPRPPAPSFVSGGMQVQEYQPRNEHQERSSGYHEGSRGSAMPSQTDHDYTNPEEAEAVFLKLLRRTGVQPDWTWQQTMKAAIKDPNWRSIKDPKDRKVAFDKYVAEVRAQEKDREKDRQAKLRTDFTSMLRSHPEIKYYTRWKTAEAMIEGETIFKTARSEEEARTLFNEYRSELLKKHIETEADTRKYALDKLTKLLGDLHLEAYTRWSEAQTALKNNERFQGDPDFKTLSKIDVLKTFETHIKNLERTFNDKRQKQKAMKYRKERENRDEFKELLRDLKKGGRLHARSKWVEVHNLIEDDPRYVAMLGQSGSTPLDLFFDELEVEEDRLRGKRHDALDVLEDRRFEMTPKTSLEEFTSIMKTDPRTGTMDSNTVQAVFERLREKVVRRSDEDRHVQRRAVDALRSRIRHLEPPVSLQDTWDQVRPRVERSEEYRALDNDDLRRQAFDRVIKKLKDLQEEDDRDSHRGKNRERERRGGSDRPDSRRDRHRTRTPEVDAYAADRKRAQADRERQYRRGSFGVSPPPSEGSRRGDRRDRESRDDRYEPPPRGTDRYDGRSSRYEREREPREKERDRTERDRGFVSRADPRDQDSGALDYGDDTGPLSAGGMSTGSRRRRDTDSIEPGRDPKRLRASDSHSPRSTRNGTPAVKEPDVAYKSGSEEGEIEEE